jgi:hypothetical protein
MMRSLLFVAAAALLSMILVPNIYATSSPNGSPLCDEVQFKVSCYDRNDNPKEYCEKYGDNDKDFCKLLGLD